MATDPGSFEGEVAELLVALIRNGCVNDGTVESGHESRSVATLQDYFGEEGTVLSFAEDRGNLILRIPGRDAEAPSFGLMGHLDVVPVSPAGWTRDPFGGEMAGGEIWGRGAVDMLNMTAAMAAVFKRYLHQLPPLRGDLVFLAVADEEAGSRWGVERLMASQPDLIACDYLLTEVPLPSVATPKGRFQPVAVGEKGPFWRILRSRGVPGHGSQPYRMPNALLSLARGCSALAEEPSPVEITPEWRSFVDALSLPGDLGPRLVEAATVDAAIEELAETSIGFARYAHACTHMTLSPNLMRAGTKANVIPDAAEAQVDIRTLPGQDASTVDDHLRKVLGPDYEQLEVEPMMDFPSRASPASGMLWDAIAAAVDSLTPGTPIVPTFAPMTTDARFFRAGGTVAYGVALFDRQLDLGGFLARFHGNDERVSVSSLGATAALYARALERFDELSST